MELFVYRAPGRVVLHPKSQQQKVLDYGDSLVDLTVSDRHIVVTYWLSTQEPKRTLYREKRLLDLSVIWKIACEGGDTVEVGDDDVSLHFCKTGATISFPAAIQYITTLSDGGALIVLKGNDETNGRNVYRYAPDGSQVWRIGPRRHNPAMPFTVVGFDKDGVLRADGPLGFAAIVDFETGDVVDIDFYIK